MAGVDTFPAEPAARRLAPLPALGLRVGGARPGPAAGGDRASPRRSAASRGRSTSSARCGSRPAKGSPRRSRPCGASSTPTPTLRFKLDPTNDWDDELIAELVETGAVDSLDLKGFYKGTPVDVETDPELYSKLIEAFPDAWLEDPDVNDETRPILEPVRDRLTWDAPIHSIADIEALPWPPRMVNIKPSRIGGLRDLCDDLRLLRRARDRRLRRRPVGARRRPRPDPGPRLALPPRHPQRHRPARLQRSRAAARPADQPARARSTRPASAGVIEGRASLARQSADRIRPVRGHPVPPSAAELAFRYVADAPRKGDEMAEKASPHALNEQIANEFAASAAVRRERPSTTTARPFRGSPPSSTARRWRSASTR